MFTSSQKIADAKVNSRIFISLALIGAVCGVIVWHQLLPATLPDMPLWRIVFALATDPRQREFWQKYNVIYHLFLSIAGGALGLPLAIAAVKKIAKRP